MRSIYFDRSTIVDVLDRVESKGWISVSPPLTTERIKLLTLSPAGQDVQRQVAPAIRRVREWLLAPLTSSEAKTMIHLFVKMADAGDDERVGPAKVLLFLCFLVVAIDGFDTARSNGATSGQLGKWHRPQWIDRQFPSRRNPPRARKAADHTLRVAIPAIVSAFALATLEVGRRRQLREWL